MYAKIIAEIGSNWEGDVELGKLHIESAKKSGASFVKFQMWRARDLYDKSHPNWNEITKSELTQSAAKELKSFADKIGIGFFCSVFYPEAVDFLETLDVPIYKIASRTSTLKDKFSFETIQRVAKVRKPIYISVGEGGDRKKISDQFMNDKYQFTYCVSNYPTSDNDIDWKEIMKYDFFSDHTLGITIPIVFATLKKNNSKNDIFIEKHTRLETSKGPDASFAITYKELSELAKHLRRIENLSFPTQ
ncbi:N-acetylneuraminate synthase family protein [Candidatus Nitrosotalea okcheonensis]|uniref:Sialic acid synthase n=1 Tax=Candidatus Nitrosotalea okcheonensis TaxID=1903276 RepID=A0A2H1FHR0_9ARCH|nr:N-acetylneuraminate synthase family protein [Candidatus Nitrosotalea okcheonensis]SMH72310.1 Sialic acid synthase [Candidatus Nitrosotalea okcheonensis]